MLEVSKREIFGLLNKKYIEQEEVNKILKNIVKILKSIPSIGNDYMEYISAIIYVIYENNIMLQDVLKNKRDDDIINVIESGLNNIRKKENSKKLFSNVNLYRIFYSESKETLKYVIIALSELIAKLEDLEGKSKTKLAIAFEYLIMKAAQDSEISFKNGEFYTPKGVVKTMVNLLNMKSNMAIYNPSCGVGNFITEAAKCTEIYAFGEESNISNYNICITNLWLHDVYNKRIKEDNYEKFQKVDFVIANPPFVSNLEEDIDFQDIYYKYDINQSASSYIKFIVKMIECVHKEGKIAVVVPQGFLFKRTAEARLRRLLLEKNYIDAIIELPEKLFYNTKISVVILIIDKARKGKERIIFINASKEYTSKRKTNILTVENQEKIVNTYKNYEEIGNYSHIATLEEIQNNNYDLSISKYVKSRGKVEHINQREVKAKIYELEEQKREIQKEIENLMNSRK